MDDFSEADVLNEEIIIHPTVEWNGKSWKGEARIIGKVMINGREYEFEHVVTVTFKKARTSS